MELVFEYQWRCRFVLLLRLAKQLTRSGFKVLFVFSRSKATVSPTFAPPSSSLTQHHNFSFTSPWAFALFAKIFIELSHHAVSFQEFLFILIIIIFLIFYKNVKKGANNWPANVIINNKCDLYNHVSGLDFDTFKRLILIHNKINIIILQLK